jgi:hypothetical protein
MTMWSLFQEYKYGSLFIKIKQYAPYFHLGSIKDENGTRGRYEVDPKMPCFLFHQ